MFRIETARTFLREILGNDFEFLLEMMSDAEVMRYYPSPLDARQVRAFIGRMRRHYLEDGCGLWLVVDRETGSPLGRVGLIRQPVDGRDEFEISYMIHRPYWRQGFATEAALAVREHAFAERRLAGVISLIRPANLPSQGVARKLGMQPRGTTVHAGLEHLVFAVESRAS